MSEQRFHNAGMNEKAAFSQRLITSLKRAGIDPSSPTKVAIAFNLQHQGLSVSTQAVHKWLSGLAIPSQDKIRTLARWLRVTPEWLRFGETASSAMSKGGRVKQERASLPITDEMVQEAFARLTGDHREVVREVIATLLRLQADRNGEKSG